MPLSCFKNSHFLFTTDLCFRKLTIMKDITGINMDFSTKRNMAIEEKNCAFMCEELQNMKILRNTFTLNFQQVIYKFRFFS